MKGRKRTTAKILIPTKGEGLTEKALRQALSDLRRDDPALDAVLIWAYKDRSELNKTFRAHKPGGFGSGKLEWSKDKT